MALFGMNRYTFVLAWVVLGFMYCVTLFLTPESWAGILLVSCLSLAGTYAHMWAGQSWCNYISEEVADAAQQKSCPPYGCAIRFFNTSSWPTSLGFALMVGLIVCMVACIISWAVLKGLTDHASEARAQSLQTITTYVTLALAGFTVVLSVITLLIGKFVLKY